MALTAAGTSLPPEPPWGRSVFLAGEPEGVRGSQSGRGVPSSVVADSGTVAGPACLRVSATAAAMPRASAEPPEGVLLTLLARMGDWNAESVPAHSTRVCADCQRRHDSTAPSGEKGQLAKTARRPAAGRQRFGSCSWRRTCGGAPWLGGAAGPGGGGRLLLGLALQGGAGRRRHAACAGAASAASASRPCHVAASGWGACCRHDHAQLSDEVHVCRAATGATWTVEGRGFALVRWRRSLLRGGSGGHVVVPGAPVQRHRHRPPLPPQRLAARCRRPRRSRACTHWWQVSAAGSASRLGLICR